MSSFSVGLNWRDLSSLLQLGLSLVHILDQAPNPLADGFHFVDHPPPFDGRIRFHGHAAQGPQDLVDEDVNEEPSQRQGPGHSHEG